MKLATALALCLALAAPASAVTASDQPAVPLSVTAVVTGGEWAAGSQRGLYRVVIYTQGAEHVSSTARIEWLSNTPSGELLPGLAAHTEIREIPDGLWSLGSPRLTQGQGDEAVLEIDGIHTYEGNGHTFAFRLGSPGKYRVR